MAFEEIFISAFIPLQHLFGKDLGEQALKIYRSVLESKLNADELKIACVKLAETFKPSAACQFPAPVDFFVAAHGNKDERSMAAVALIRKSRLNAGRYEPISFGDPALHRTIESFGGWAAIYDKDDDWWGFNEKRFRMLYEHEIGNKSDQPIYLSGEFEMQNRIGGFTLGRVAPPVNVKHIGTDGVVLAELPLPVYLEAPGREGE